jgi:hypothetical protein
MTISISAIDILVQPVIIILDISKRLKYLTIRLYSIIVAFMWFALLILSAFSFFTAFDYYNEDYVWPRGSYLPDSVSIALCPLTFIQL